MSDCLDAEDPHRTPSSSSLKTSSWGCDGGARRYACSAWNWLPCSILSQTSRFLPYPCNNAILYPTNEGLLPAGVKLLNGVFCDYAEPGWSGMDLDREDLGVDWVYGF